ncbi:TPA: hypothetical protein N0F65_006581 [Lagenidium giganteum]|uniref:EF-hand domain-containing protein n=1 Tax=Lagenidium giganteum TaxID=4803 RepID=A0AAV2Z918_9STRA|nr:TPA: hypothetical protein N0F65_006581 [Lagenidium giganteum]
MSALEELQELYNADPETERIILRGKELESVDLEMEYLHVHFANVRHLDLSDNHLEMLPVAFGQQLPKLVALDVTKNPFRSVTELVDILQKCPSLKSLSVTLKNATEEKLLLVMLPKLRILNGTPLPFTSNPPLPPAPAASPRSIEAFSSMLAAPLSSAAAPPASPQEKRTLKLQFASIKQQQQQQLRQQQGQSTDQTATQPRRARIQSGPRSNERLASTSDERTDWRKLLKNQPHGSGNSEQSTALGLCTTADFFAQLKAIVKCFHQSSTAQRQASGVSSQRDEIVYRQLDQHVDMLARQWEQHVAKRKPQDAVQTRWSLLEVCGVYGVDKTSQVDATLGRALEMMFRLQKELLTAALVGTATSGTTKDSPAKSPANAQVKQQMKTLLEVAETLERDLEAAQSKLQREQSEREALQEENWSLARENASLKRKTKLDIPIDNTSAAATSAATTSGSAGRRRKRLENSSASAAVGPPGSSTKAIGGASTAPVTLRTSPSKKSPTNKVITNDSTRSLTYKQLIDLLGCILASKAKYDKHTTATGAPRETVEQHMYTYLNQRFGLHVLIVDYACAIWKGCQKYQMQSNDAAAFLALLQNHVDEGFVVIKKKLQQALLDLLRAYFQAKYPLKQETAIAALVQNRIQNLLNEQEWQEMLTYLYDPQDSAVLLRIVRKKAEQFHASQQTTPGYAKAKTKAPPSGLTLPYVTFEKLLYDYQLQGRLKLLECFRQLFDGYDTERVGIIDRDRFRQLVHVVAPKRTEDDIEQLVTTVDPFHHDAITFSDAVACLLKDIRIKSAQEAHAKGNASPVSFLV